MKQPTTLSNYSVIADPHMYYYLQSPQKVSQLLRTGLYSLQGSTLIEKQSKRTLQLEDYVVDKLSTQAIRESPSRKELAQILNSPKFKAFEREKEQVKKMRVPANWRGREGAMEGGQIRGLRQFLRGRGE